MIDLKNIRSLSDFQRNTKEHMERLAGTGEPEVLTVNGEAKLVVQDAEAYQKLVERVEAAELAKLLKKRLEESIRGKGIPLGKWDAAMRKKHKIARDA